MSGALGYLVHDLGDAAVGRRLSMLRRAGADVRLAGFRRSDSLPSFPEGLSALDLGRSHDGRLVRRLFGVGHAALVRRARLRHHIGDVEALIARNVEMLAVAIALAQDMRPTPRIVYECLDLHRLLLSDGLPARLVRGIEARLRRSVDLTLTSSPAFVARHFQPEADADRVMLVENRIPSTETLTRAAPTPSGPPWKIGWFGALRCRRSFEILSTLAERGNGRIEVVIRGRPSPAVFPDLEKEAAAVPNLRFKGAYRYPEDLARIYGEVHFAWCLDFYEDNLNSSMLLPNRLYEGCYHRTVPIALESVETGRFLTSRGIGLVLPAPIERAIEPALAGLSGGAYDEAISKISALPVSTWVSDSADCEALLDAVFGRNLERERAA
jgi:hypothetical protein